jgi:predicted ribosome quality control (RQC) complex YloA/Tae2 family protein
MPKNSISSLELAAIVNELQFLIRGKLSQIYHQEKKELMFQLHAQGQGKQLLKIIPGKYLCLTKKKDAPLKPSSYCMQLRKYISNSTINKIYQHKSDRVIVFELEKAEKFKLIIELYSKGNLILIDDKNKIIAALHRQKFRDREVKVGETYKFPESGISWDEIDEKNLFSTLKKSEKKNLATALAIEFGLGGLYAEEACKLSSVEKGKLPEEITKEDAKGLVKAIKQFLKQIENPLGYIYEEQMTPFPLIEEKESKKVDSYSAALDTLNPFKTVSPYEQKINTIKRMVAAQEKATGKQEKSIELNTKKGELVYEKYADLQKLIDFVNTSLREGKEWSEVEKELKKVKKIVKIDLKNKKIRIDL